MKKLIILAVAMLMALVSCTPESKLTGSWNGESITMEASGASITMNLAEMKMSIVLTFDNGTATVVSTTEGETSTETLKYTVSGNTIVVENEAPIEYSIKGKTLTLTGDGELFDSPGKVTITFQKI